MNQANKVLEGAVIGRLTSFVEAAPWKLSHPEMVGDALAAYPLSRSRIIGASAPGQVFVFVEFHWLSLLHRHISCASISPKRFLLQPPPSNSTRWLMLSLP